MPFSNALPTILDSNRSNRYLDCTWFRAQGEYVPGFLEATVRIAKSTKFCGPDVQGSHGRRKAIRVKELNSHLLCGSMAAVARSEYVRVVCAAHEPSRFSDGNLSLRWRRRQSASA